MPSALPIATIDGRVAVAIRPGNHRGSSPMGNAGTSRPAVTRIGPPVVATRARTAPSEPRDRAIVRTIAPANAPLVTHPAISNGATPIAATAGAPPSDPTET